MNKTVRSGRIFLRSGVIFDNLCHLWTVIKKMYGGVRGFMRPTEVASGTTLAPKARRARSERLYIKSTLFCDQEELVSSGGWNIGAIIKRRLAEIAVFSLWWICDSFVTYKCRLRCACMAAMLLRISGHAIIKGSFVNTLSVYYL